MSARSLLRAAVATVAIGAMTLAAAGPAIADPPSPGDAYAAFGDSYSAGEGTLAYLPGTNIPGVNMCHRSTLAYSGVLDNEQGLGTLGFAACSGAVTADLFAPNNNHNLGPNGQPEPAQLCTTAGVDGISPCGDDRAPVIGGQTRNVTLTIGGNDLGFAHIVRACIFAQVGKYHLGDPGRGCSTDPLVVAPAARRLAALAGIGTNVDSAYHTTIHSWTSVLGAIHAVAPSAHVYIAGYPRLFQQQGTSDCVVGAVNGSVPVKIAAKDAAWIDHSIAAVDALISVAADEAGRWATYVNPQPAFTGHGLCTAAPWINPVTVTIKASRSGHVQVAVDTGSVHPTSTGQNLGYAHAFAAAGITASN